MKKNIKLIIAGTRDFCNPDSMRSEEIERLTRMANEQLEIISQKYNIIEVVSGGAKGADKFGEEWAKEREIPVSYFLANWHEFGKRAGPIRNQQMADYADRLMIFWNGYSKGTKNMMSLMREAEKTTFIALYQEE